MTEYALVVTTEPGSISFDGDAMRQELVIRWPGTEVFPSPAFEGDNSLFHANVATQPSVITVELDESQRLIGMEPTAPSELAEFVVWALRYLPGGTEATLYGPDYNSERTVSARDTVQQISRFLAT